jgi:hypothetical protein
MGSSTTTRNFGMRRFTNLVREGRFRAPASGTELRLGTLVEIDPSDTSRIREADATTGVAIGGSGDVRTNLCGILWYEHDSQTFNDPRFGGAAGQLPQDLDTAPNGRMVQVLHGPGAKVWFRNTGDSETEPGLHYSNTRPAVTMVFGIGGATPTTAVDELLGWDATNNYWTVTTNQSEAFLRVTAVDNTLLTVDAEIIV